MEKGVFLQAGTELFEGDGTNWGKFSPLQFFAKRLLLVFVSRNCVS